MDRNMVFLIGFVVIGSPIGFVLGTELAKMFPIESNLWGYLLILFVVLWVAVSLLGYSYL